MAAKADKQRSVFRISEAYQNEMWWPGFQPYAKKAGLQDKLHSTEPHSSSKQVCSLGSRQLMEAGLPVSLEGTREILDKPESGPSTQRSHEPKCD